jgi:hypothetical protein
VSSRSQAESELNAQATTTEEAAPSTRSNGKFGFDKFADLFGDLDLDMLRDNDTTTPDMKKDHYKAPPKRQLLDELPDFPVRRPMFVTKEYRERLMQEGVYIWQPDSFEKGSLNQIESDDPQMLAGENAKPTPPKPEDDEYATQLSIYILQLL